MPAGKAKRALQVAQAIVSDIQLNAREAGDRLPQEEDMLARYEVARATLREALRFLELQGVIQLQLGRGGGPVVSRPQTRDFASSLSLILQFMDTDLGPCSNCAKRSRPIWRPRLRRGRPTQISPH